MSTVKDNLFKYVFLAGLFIIPFVFWPKANIPYEIPRVYFVIRWIEVLGLLGIFSFILKRQKEKLDIKLIVLVIAFVFSVLISSINGVNFFKSFWGNYYRADGLLTLFHLASLLFLVSLLFKRKWLNAAITTIAWSSALISIWSLIASFRLNIIGVKSIPNWNSVVGVSFGNPNFLVGFLLVTLPFLFHKATHTKNTKVNTFLVLFIIQIFAILQTQSRAGVLGIIIFSASMLLRIVKERKTLLIVLTLYLSVLLTVIFSQYYAYKNKNDFVAEGRERIIVKALKAFISRPILGWGWANFDYAFDSVIWPIKIQHDVYVDKAHSQFLETLVAGGIVTLTLYFLIIIRVGANFFKKGRLKNPFFVAFLIYIIHSQMNIISISEEIFFWLSVGISAKK